MRFLFFFFVDAYLAVSVSFRLSDCIQHEFNITQNNDTITGENCENQRYRRTIVDRMMMLFNFAEANPFDASHKIDRCLADLIAIFLQIEHKFSS